MKEHALVTGGAGFIGSALVRLLVKSGGDVTVFDNLSFGKRGNIPAGVRFIRGDLRSERSLRNLFSRSFDRVYHLAALHFIPYCNAHPSEALSVNVDGTRLLLEACLRRPPKRLFFASTAAVYDTSSKRHEESELPMPMDIYGITKLAGEHLVRGYQSASGVTCAIGRLFNAYGPNETNPHLVPHILAQISSSDLPLKLGNLKPYRDYIHTSDMVRAVHLLTSKTRKGGLEIANIASGKELSVLEVVRVFERVLKRKLPVRSVSKLRRRQERAHLRPSLRQLRRLTGFRPKVRFEDGIFALLSEAGLVD